MAREVSKPKEDKAPAYFAQYAALWCVMLAFFIALLTLGSEQTAEFKTGLGFIRDAFGLKGGLGVLPYWRLMTEGNVDKFPETHQHETDEDGDLIGYFKGLLWKEGIASVSILKVQVDDLGVRIVLHAPIEFGKNSAVLDQRSRDFLGRLGAVLYNVPDTVISVCGFSGESGDDNEDLWIASERASAVTRFLQDVYGVTSARMEALAYASPRYIEELKEPVPEQAVIVIIRKDTKPRISARDA